MGSSPTYVTNKFFEIKIYIIIFKWGGSSVGRAGKNETILCMFSSPNKEIASIKVTSKFHEKDRVVSSSLTLPTKCPADGIDIHTGLRDQVFRVRLPGGVLKPII